MELKGFIDDYIFKLETLKDLVDLRPAFDDEDDTLTAEYGKLAKSSVLLASTVKEYKEEAELSRQIKAETESLAGELVAMNLQVDSLMKKIPKYLPSRQRRDADQSENLDPRPEATGSTNHSKARGAAVKLGSSVNSGKSKGSKVCPPPQLSYITSNEFISVPAYMRGRIPYSDANKAIDIINLTAVEKYKIMRKTKGLTDYQRRKKMEFLDLETKETENVHFVTDQDITELSSTKIDKSFLSLMPILRHCGRIRQMRAQKTTKHILLAKS